MNSFAWFAVLVSQLLPICFLINYVDSRCTHTAPASVIPFTRIRNTLHQALVDRWRRVRERESAQYMHKCDWMTEMPLSLLLLCKKKAHVRLAWNSRNIYGVKRHFHRSQSRRHCHATNTKKWQKNKHTHSVCTTVKFTQEFFVSFQSAASSAAECSKCFAHANVKVDISAGNCIDHKSDKK